MEAVPGKRGVGRRRAQGWTACAADCTQLKPLLAAPRQGTSLRGQQPRPCRGRTKQATQREQREGWLAKEGGVPRHHSRERERYGGPDSNDLREWGGWLTQLVLHVRCPRASLSC